MPSTDRENLLIVDLSLAISSPKTIELNKSENENPPWTNQYSKTILDPAEYSKNIIEPSGYQTYFSRIF